MTFHVSDIKNKRLQASADRIDSDGNYSINNVQIVCTVVNTMKSDMSTKDFLRWCALVLNGRNKVEEELLSVIG